MKTRGGRQKKRIFSTRRRSKGMGEELKRGKARLDSCMDEWTDNKGMEVHWKKPGLMEEFDIRVLG